MVPKMIANLYGITPITQTKFGKDSIPEKIYLGGFRSDIQIYIYIGICFTTNLNIPV